MSKKKPSAEAVWKIGEYVYRKGLPEDTDEAIRCVASDVADVIGTTLGDDTDKDAKVRSIRARMGLELNLAVDRIQQAERGRQVGMRQARAPMDAGRALARESKKEQQAKLLDEYDGRGLSRENVAEGARALMRMHEHDLTEWSHCPRVKAGSTQQLLIPDPLDPDEWERAERALAKRIRTAMKNSEND